MIPGTEHSGRGLRRVERPGGRASSRAHIFPGSGISQGSRGRSPSQRRSPSRGCSLVRGFTLLELMMVIAIIGIVAAISVPTLRGLRPNAKVAGTRDLLSAVTRARQLAISQRSTVYMLFVPTNFFVGMTGTNWGRVQPLADKQLTGYAFVSLRSVGDQPGIHTPQFLSRWETLAKGAYIPLAKFSGPRFWITNDQSNTLAIDPFPATNIFPFPSENNPVTSPVWLPYIAFDGMGQLVSGQPGQPELIPLAEGSVSIARDGNTRVALAQPAQANEQPAGNTIDNYSVVYIDRLTGRAHVERRKAQ